MRSAASAFGRNNFAASPTPRRLLILGIIASLLLAAAGAWLSVVNAVAQHRDMLAAPAPPAARSTPEEVPRKYTQPFLPGLVPFGANAPSVHLYASPTTARFLASVGGDYGSLLAPWRTLLRGKKIAYVETSRLQDVRRSPSTVIIIPSAVALSAAERRQLSELQRAGANFLTTWSLGARDERGEWRGYGLLGELFGVDVAGEVATETEERFLNLLGERPLTLGYPAGRRVWLEATPEKMLRLSGGEPAARYMDWLRSPAPARVSSTAIAFGERDVQHHRARWVAIGFSESSWGKQADQIAGVLQNAVHWLGHGISVTKAAWPFPYQAAYLLEMDTEEGFGNAYRFARLIESIDARATFYCLTSEAVRFPNMVRELAKRHEIAYHGDVHVGFVAQSEAVQRQRIATMQRDMRLVIDTAIPTVGFRAPLEQYEETTERVLLALGFRHHAADPNRTEARLPFFAGIAAGGDARSAAERALVVLPRTQHDDISLPKAAPEGERQMLDLLRFEFDQVLEMGAFGLLSIHSQHFGENSPLANILPELLTEVGQHRQEVWTTAANDIAEWWRERERLTFRTDGTGDDLRLTVTITGERPLREVALLLTHHRAGEAWHVQPAAGASGKRPAIQRLDRFRTALVFGSLPPGKYVYRLTGTRASGERPATDSLSPPARQSARLPRVRPSSASNTPAS